jgi:hypothetical protein
VSISTSCDWSSKATRSNLRGIDSLPHSNYFVIEVAITKKPLRGTPTDVIWLNARSTERDPFQGSGDQLTRTAGPFLSIRS